MINPKIRIISAQGPTQLINVLAILKYQLRNEVAEPWEDHLVIGGLYTERCSDTTERMIESCIKISQYWQFKSIKYLSDQDLSIDVSFLNTVERVNQKLDLKYVSSVYVCRNWQPFNEILLESYKNASKICYGDGFGLLDINDTKFQAMPINPEGYQEIDKAYLFMPIEADSKRQSFSLVENIIQPPIDYLINTINDISSRIPDLKIYATNLLNNNLDKKLTLVTTSNLTEAGCIKDRNKTDFLYIWIICQKKLLRLLLALNRRLRILKIYTLERGINFLIHNIKRLSGLHNSRTEVSMYFDQISRCCDRDEFIIVKPHPRETLKQSLQLVNRLSEAGYEAIVIVQDLSCFSIELFLNLLSFSKVISLTSSSAISARLLLDIEDHKIIPWIDSDIREKYLADFFVNTSYEKMFLDMLEQARVKSFFPLRLVDYER
jgi:hypothetical protein